MTVPPARYANVSATTWMVGETAFGSACTMTMRQRDSPLSAAISMNSLSSTSIMVTRVIRKTYGKMTRTSVATGRTRILGWENTEAPGGTIDTGGSHRKIGRAHSELQSPI